MGGGEECGAEAWEGLRGLMRRAARESGAATELRAPGAAQLPVSRVPRLGTSWGLYRPARAPRAGEGLEPACAPPSAVRGPGGGPA